MRQNSPSLNELAIGLDPDLIEQQQRSGDVLQGLCTTSAGRSHLSHGHNSCHCKLRCAGSSIHSASFYRQTARSSTLQASSFAAEFYPMSRVMLPGRSYSNRVRMPPSVRRLADGTATPPVFVQAWHLASCSPKQVWSMRFEALELGSDLRGRERGASKSGCRMSQ